jgi:ABC-type antimicrobial peptide transport system permease subunit
VVGDVKVAGLTDPVSHGMEVYMPPDPRQSGGFYTILARSDRDPQAAVALIKQTLWHLDPRIPVTDAMSMNDRIAQSLYRQRFFVRLSTTFTAIATVLAMIGMHGTAAYWVARRRRELAIRIAVGAAPVIVMRGVILRMARLAVFGAAFGIVLALAGARTLQSMLFAIDARDPATLAVVSVVLVMVAIVACAVPAARAARVDPMTTLRTE